MPHDSHHILSVLDDACDAFTFPMLDNGFVYLAATRLSLHRSATDWAIVFEIFSFSPRAGLPDLGIHTFASRLHNRNPREHFDSDESYQEYLTGNPHYDARFLRPIPAGPWQDPTHIELVSSDAREITVRDHLLPLPPTDAYPRHGITLEQPPRVQTFELCRYLAAAARDRVLATPQEQRISVPPDMTPLLQLDDWHHPDVANDHRPSQSETFQQLAQVLANGDPALYRPTLLPNTGWHHWPEAGRL